MGRVGPACSAPTAAAPSPSRPTGKTWRCAPRAPAAHAPTPRWVTRPRAPERSGAAPEHRTGPQRSELSCPRQPVAQRIHDQPHTIPHAELLKDVGEMCLHRALADRERRAHLLVLLAGGDEAHDLALSLGEAVLVAAARGGALGSEVGEFLYEGARHARVDPDLARAHGVDGLHEGLACGVLQDDALGAELEGPHVLFLLVTGGEHEDAGSRTDAQDGGDRVEAAPLWHPDVEEQDVGLGLPNQLHDVLGALGVCDHLDVVLHLEDRAQALAEQRVVIDDDEAESSRLSDHASNLRSGSRDAAEIAAGIVRESSAPRPASVRTHRVPPSAAQRSRMDQGAAPGGRKPSASVTPRPFWKPRPLSRTTR